jgi:hypothetical protein
MQWLRFKPEERVWEPLGIQALSVSTGAADLLALDSRLTNLNEAVIATFQADAVKSDHDIILYNIGSRGGRFGSPLTRGCIRDSDLRSWK